MSRRTQRHLPVWPPAWRLELHYQERLQRGGAPLPVRPRLRRPRSRRPIRAWQVAEVTGHAVVVLLATGLSIAAVLAVVAPVAHGMRWI